jgi:hypothetical protein
VRISGFNWACVCRYEVERIAALLMILGVKFVGHKKRAIKTEREKPAYHALKNQLKTKHLYENSKVIRMDHFPI